jgi:hypothetical protein
LDKVTREQKRLHNEELGRLYFSPKILRVTKWRRMVWAGHVARTGKGAYRVLLGRCEGRRPPGTLRRRLEDNIKMYFEGVEWGGMIWIDLAEDRDRRRVA